MSHNNSIFKETCLILDLYAIPYVGKYSYNYEFMVPYDIHCCEKIPDNVFKSLPELMKTSLINLDVSEAQYYVVNADISSLVNFEKYDIEKLKHYRLNMAPHPCIFKDTVILEKEHRVPVVGAIYNLNFSDSILVCNENEK